MTMHGSWFARVAHIFRIKAASFIDRWRKNLHYQNQTRTGNKNQYLAVFFLCLLVFARVATQIRIVESQWNPKRARIKWAMLVDLLAEKLFSISIHRAHPRVFVIVFWTLIVMFVYHSMGGWCFAVFSLPQIWTENRTHYVCSTKPHKCRPRLSDAFLHFVAWLGEKRIAIAMEDSRRRLRDYLKLKICSLEITNMYIKELHGNEAIDNCDESDIYACIPMNPTGHGTYYCEWRDNYK